MHLIYSKLKSVNAMNGKLQDKGFSIEFLPDKKTKVSDKEFDALMAEEESALSFLLACGDFVEDAESATSEIASLKGELKKLGLKLKKAEDAVKQSEKQEDALGVKDAEFALQKAEDAFKACEDASQKKALLTTAKQAKKALELAKKEAKKAAKD